MIWSHLSGRGKNIISFDQSDAKNPIFSKWNKEWIWSLKSEAKQRFDPFQLNWGKDIISSKWSNAKILFFLNETEQ